MAMAHSHTSRDVDPLASRKHRQKYLAGVFMINSYGTRTLALGGLNLENSQSVRARPRLQPVPLPKGRSSDELTGSCRLPNRRCRAFLIGCQGPCFQNWRKQCVNSTRKKQPKPCLHISPTASFRRGACFRRDFEL